MEVPELGMDKKSGGMDIKGQILSSTNRAVGWQNRWPSVSFMSPEDYLICFNNFNVYADSHERIENAKYETKTKKNNSTFHFRKTGLNQVGTLYKLHPISYLDPPTLK